MRFTIQNCARLPRDPGWAHFRQPDGRWIHWPYGRLEGLEGVPVDVAEGDVPVLTEGMDGVAPLEAAARPFIWLEVDGREVEWTEVRLEDDGWTAHLWGRVPGSMLVAHLFILMNPGHEWPWELYLGNCDITRPDLVAQVDTARLRADLPSLFIATDCRLARGGGPTPGCLLNYASAPSWLRHGQGLAWSGRILDTRYMSDPGAAHGPVTAMSLDWLKVGWGPARRPAPQPHPDLDQVAAMRDLAVAFFDRIDRPGGMMDLWHYGLTYVPSSTGDQQDFGWTKLAPLFTATGNPFHLYELLPAVLSEASRPSHFFEPDGRPLDLGLHPDWATWGLYTHWDRATSPDTLGKLEDPEVPNNRFYFKDWAHFSSLNLAGYAIVTGSPLARFLCRHEITAGVAYGRYFGLGQERAYGRWSQAMAWLHRATGDERMLPAFAEAMDHRDWQELDSQIAEGFEVRVFKHDRDDRYLKGKYEHWNPWHQGLLIQGVYAFLLEFGNESPRVAARMKALCRTHIRYGWRKIDGRWWVGYAVRWKDGGVPLTEEEMQDPGQWMPSYRTAFNQWCWPAVRAAREYLEDAEDRAKAKEIDDWLTAEWRSAPPVGLRDRTLEWML